MYVQYSHTAVCAVCVPNVVFTEGNKETLMSLPSSRGQDVRKELLEFHSKYYSSNVMALAVLGKGECSGNWESVHYDSDDRAV